MSNEKMGKRYADILTILLVIVIIAILCLLGYFGFRAVNKHNVGTNASSALDEFKKSIAKKPDSVDDTVEENVSNDVEDRSASLQNFLNTNTDASSQNPSSSDSSRKSGVKKTYLDGYEIKGEITIKKPEANVNIDYPILNRVTVESLKKSVAILEIKACSEITTTVEDLNVPGTNALILGHNYRNGLFFSDNDKLKLGDKIQITDQLGVTITYTIYNAYYTDPNDIKFLQREIDPNVREITLQTCNEDSSQRLILWAKDS